MSPARRRRTIGAALLTAALVIVPVAGASAEDAVIGFEIEDSSTTGQISFEIVSILPLTAEPGATRYRLRLVAQGRGTLSVFANGTLQTQQEVDSAARAQPFDIDLLLIAGRNAIRVEFVARDGVTSESESMAVSVAPAAPTTVTIDSPRDTGAAAPRLPTLAATGLAVTGAAGAGLALTAAGLLALRRRHRSARPREETSMA